MKWDIHTAVLCSFSFFMIMYYYHSRLRSSLQFSKDEDGRREVFLNNTAVESSEASTVSQDGDPFIEEISPVYNTSSTIATINYSNKHQVSINHENNSQSTEPKHSQISMMELDSEILEKQKRSVNHTVSKDKMSKSEDVTTKQIFEIHKLLKSQNNIFFIETSCSVNNELEAQNKPILKPRQACAIYSTAHHNPSKHVILIVTCPLLRNFYQRSPEFMKALFDLPNFYVAPVNLTEMYEQSPLSQISHGPLRRSAFPVEHNADLLRILLIYLYGGTYMDLDIVTMRPLDDLGVNYIGAETFDAVATGVFNFEANHPYLRRFLEEAHKAYRAQEWNSIGPMLATSVLVKYCNLTLQESNSLTHVGYLPSCGIRVLSKEAFYPIRHWDWKLYLYDTSWPTVKSYLNQTYAAHVWNHKSGTTPVKVGSNQPYAILARLNCAAVYRNCGDIF